MLLKYYAPESGGEGGGGGGIEITPEIQKLIDERVTSEVTGLKTKNSELLGTIKQQKENLSRFEGTAKGDNPDLTAIGTAGNWKKHSPATNLRQAC